MKNDWHIYYSEEDDCYSVMPSSVEAADAGNLVKIMEDATWQQALDAKEKLITDSWIE